MMDKIGTMRSKTIRSLEKRVTIRPIGFESKKMIFARKTRYVIASCKFVLLFRIILNRATERITVMITNPPMSAPKTIGYIDFCCSSRSPSSHRVSHRDGNSYAIAQKTQIKKMVIIPQHP